MSIPLRPFGRRPLNVFDAAFRSFAHRVRVPRSTVCASARPIAADGRFERFKTTGMHDADEDHAQPGVPPMDELAH